MYSCLYSTVVYNYLLTLLGNFGTDTQKDILHTIFNFTKFVHLIASPELASFSSIFANSIKALDVRGNINYF